MKSIRRVSFALCLSLTGCATSSINPSESRQDLIIRAAHVFDGKQMRANTAVLIHDNKIAAIDQFENLNQANTRVLDLGEATLLPGVIELHAHSLYRKLPSDVILAHGVTTIRDMGGPVAKTQGGNGQLRRLTVGSLLTAPGGYPIPGLGVDSAQTIADETQAKTVVKQLIQDGAVAIKVALEPGGEPGAPWSVAHAHSHHHAHAMKQAHYAPAGHWPLLPLAVVKAMVEQAHALDRRVIAHVGEARGAKIALAAGVDDWAHMPCAALPDPLLQQAFKQGVKIIGTLDTLSRCHGVEHNTRRWAALGGELLYGAEVAHLDIPWGIDAQELMLMSQWANMSSLQVLQTATAKAGKYLGIAKLGTIQAGAPADLIAVKGNALHNLKSLEYPGLVISGGQVVVNRFCSRREPCK